MKEENNLGDGDQALEQTSPPPSFEPRENLISTAVHFLKNPRVQNSPDYQKTAFLQKKGLTDAEIKIALEQVSVGSNTSSFQQPAYASSNQVVPISPPIVVRPPSVWSLINRVGSSVVILGIALYGINRFYKIYIEPWLFGKERKESRFTLMEQQLLEMNRSLSQLKRTVASFEETINSQKQQVDKIFQNEVNEYYPTPLMLNDLKAEVGSIKSLLLCRHQFPATPKVGPSIPIWQMATSQTAENNLEQNEKGSVKQTDSTSEPMVTGDLTQEVNKVDFEFSERDTNGDNKAADLSEDISKDNKELSEEHTNDSDQTVTEDSEAVQAS